MRFKNKYPKSTEIGKGLQSFFHNNVIEKEAIKHDFVKRNSRMTGSKFIQMCIRGTVEEGSTKSLNELCAICSKLDIEICEQSLNERFNDKAVALFKSLFNTALENQFESSDLKVLSAFSQIILEDSTTFELPESLAKIFQGFGGSASKSGLKIDYTYDLKTDYFNLQLLNARQTDLSISLPSKICFGSLWLRDLGYFKIKDFKSIEKAEAFYVSRFKHDRKIFLSTKEDSPYLNLPSLIRKLKVNEIKDIDAYIGNDRFKTRVLIQKAPAKIAKKRQAQLIKQRRKKGNPLSEQRLLLCYLSVFITNLDQEQWEANRVLKLYKIRWQIEIIFKVWKSVLKIGKTKRMKVERFLCLLYAQLIWAIINMRIFQSFKNYFWNQFEFEISEIKTYKIMKNSKEQLIEAMCRNRKVLYKKYLNDIYDLIVRLGKKEYKKGNRNSLFHI